MREEALPRFKFINAKGVFTVSLIVISLTILSVWLLGLGSSRTILHNSFLSTSILAMAFFGFLTIGLYKGIMLKNDYGSISEKIKPGKVSEVIPSGFGGSIPDVGDDLVSFLLGIVLWVVFSVLLFLFLWFFGVVFWTALVAFMAMLYWVFFRALRLVFKNSRHCAGDLAKSMLYAFGYTLLYSSWVYAIIYFSH